MTCRRDGQQAAGRDRFFDYLFFFFLVCVWLWLAWKKIAGSYCTNHESDHFGDLFFGCGNRYIWGNEAPFFNALFGISHGTRKVSAFTLLACPHSTIIFQGFCNINEIIYAPKLGTLPQPTP